MKSKKFNKKLSLNKNTVSNLNGFSMSKVKGGDVAPPTQVTHCEVSCFSKCLETCFDFTCAVDCTLSGCVTVCGSNPCC